MSCQMTIKPQCCLCCVKTIPNTIANDLTSVQPMSTVNAGAFGPITKGIFMVGSA